VSRSTRADLDADVAGWRDEIGCSKRRPWRLPTERYELMPQNEQLDILGELAAAAVQERPQRRRDSRDTRTEHPPMLPDPSLV
jgi:hypothetical protein